MVAYLVRENIEKEYKRIHKNYEKLGVNIIEALKMLLDEKGINYITVYYRIKGVDSFVEKNVRKSYEEPFEQIEDICGIRIVCYYRSDIERICEIINQEFQVIESEDKEELLKPDQFGYRSHHFIIKIKEEWLCTPNYKGLNNLKAEIQVRTNLMHTWAEIEHKLEYKKEEDIPKEFKRRFSFLSAKLEEADEQFETLKNDIIEYREKYKKKMLESVNNNIEFSGTNGEFNLDNLQTFLDCYFPNRVKNIGDASKLVTELNEHKISISMLTELYKKTERILNEMENELFAKYFVKVRWTQVGVVRLIMMLTIHEYSENMQLSADINEIIVKYKAQLCEKK